MTARKFRSLALALPEAVEATHMGHPDFRVRGKIFATLGPREAWGMVKLNPAQQALLLAALPGTFAPAAGAWGRGGSTIVTLRGADVDAVRRALTLAWRNTAPKGLVQAYEKE